MNWGYKIVVVYVLFVAGIILLVVKSSMENTDLVTSDYYEKELLYQQTIDQASRANKLTERVQYVVNDQQLKIIFPPEMNGLEVKAEVLLYCASDKKKDISHKMATSTGQLFFPLQSNSKGSFDVKITWTANGISYYNETKLIIK